MPTEREYRRVIVEPGGPILVDGPVEVELPDGTTARSDRFVVAVCAGPRRPRDPVGGTSHRKDLRDDGPRSGDPPSRHALSR